MTAQSSARYAPYARQRLFRILLDLQVADRNLNWSVMADQISEWRNIRFQRMNFYRLKKGTLGDENVELVVLWIVEKFDKDVRSKLKPQSIFHEVGVASRDYYFHNPTENNLDDWEEQFLDEFSGVYFCAPAGDKNSFIPLPVLRRWYEDQRNCPDMDKQGRSLDIKQYIQERSILILQRTLGSYFYAAEFPLSLLFPRSFVTLDIRMVYEGIGTMSSNNIQVQLRECLSHVPKTHSILISPKNANQANNPFGLSIFLPPGTQNVKEEWEKIAPADIEHFKREYAASVEAEYYMAGSAQITVSPLPYMKNRVGMTFPRELVYHRKPADFLRDRDAHFIKPGIDNTAEIEKILANPLSIGELL